MPALHQQSLRPQRLGQLLFHRRRLRALQSLQVHHRSGQYLEPPLQHAAGRPNPRLVLVEPHRGRVVRGPDVHAVRSARAVLVS